MNSMTKVKYELMTKLFIVHSVSHPSADLNLDADEK